MSRPIRPVLALLSVAVLAGMAMAQATVPIDGTVTDESGAPLEGYRVVFRNTGTTTVFLSEPSGADGRFRVDLPPEQRFLFVAVIDTAGQRTAIEGAEPFAAGPGVVPVVRVALMPEVDAPPPAFPGADRLFLSFAEDSTIVSGQRYEAQLELADVGPADGEVWVSRVVAAVQFPSIPRVEFGGRIGLASIDVAGRSDSGATDLDLWAKFLLGRTADGRTELAIGALGTVPTGDEDAGIGFDGFRSELFGAARFSFPSVIVTATVGVRANEDGESAGVPLAGETAPMLGAGVVVPLWGEGSLIGEVRWEGERFSGGDPAAEALVGVNWRPLPHGAARLAVGTGLDDGAPDWRVVLGYAFEY